ncbi:aldose epimerase family protein [Microbulbifer sp.]|uniref:aldose epimerase family protein n=1 Tax=Microbulbifer sp. TaxID=1908541 RepID=UPI00258D059E|nr:aldose epimerase family protein [Microbulbifer sp.]
MGIDVRNSLLALATMAFVGNAAVAAEAKRDTFGTLPGGEKVESVTLTGENGVSAVIITYGATLQALNVPDRNGRVADITLGHDALAGYLEQPNYWGQTIGRYANRIAGGRFVLDGEKYQLSRNDDDNSLHGGVEGFDKRNWNIESVTEGQQASVTLTLHSADGDQGYPGNMDVSVTYALDDNGSLVIDHKAETDAPTIVNLTNHALFNLAGEGSALGVYDQKLTIPASHYLPVNEKLIPTGERRAVSGTVFDFTKGRFMSDGIRDGSDEQIVMGRGWDHNWILDKGRTEKPELAARVEHAQSGRVLEVLSTEPGLQFYSGNFLVGDIVGKNGHAYRMGAGIALEPQLFPDTPNQPEFGSARLNPGETYHHRMIYRVSVEG